MAGTPSVLVVDDGAQRPAAALERRPFAVESVAGATAVAERIGHGIYDCIVTRLEVPDRQGLTYLGGFAVTETVRAVDSDVPVVLFTDVENYDVISRVTGSELFSFVPDRGDPASIDRLQTVVDRAVRHLPAHRRASQQTAINRAIRRVNEALVRAPTREQIEQAVVTVLANTDRYTTACLFEVDDSTGLIVPQAVGGDDATVAAIGARTFRVADPIVEALDQSQTVVTTRTDAPGAFEGISDRAEILCAMPLIYETADYGVLALYTDRRDAFQTDERRAFEELARNVALAIDAAQTRQALRERTQTLGRQNDRLEEFARVISHELRHPLQVAMGQVERLDDAIDDDALAAAIATIEDNHAEIAALIEDLVTLARENAREQTREPASLEAIAREAREYVDPPRPDVIVNTTAVVRVDPHRLRHLFEVIYQASADRAGAAAEIEVRSIDDGFAVVTDASALPIDPDREQFDRNRQASSDRRLSMRLLTNIVESHGWRLTTDRIGDQIRYAFHGVEFM